MSSTSDLLVTVPSLVCVGIIVVCVTAVLVAPRRFVRASLIAMLVTIVGYMAVLAIMMLGSPHLITSTEDAEDSTGTDTDEGVAPPPVPTAPDDNY